MKPEKIENPVSDRETETVNPLIIILLIWVIFLLNGAFSIPLMPPDEPKYASSAEYMLQTGDFITPYFNCQPRFDKPPVIYWLIAASYKIFGISDWAARIPSMLAALGVMFIIFRFAEGLYDRKTATMSVVVFASLIHVWVMGRAVAPEFVLVFFRIISALFFIFWTGKREKQIHICRISITGTCVPYKRTCWRYHPRKYYFPIFSL